MRFSDLTPLLLRDVLQRRISQNRNYRVIVEPTELSDMLTRVMEHPCIAATSFMWPGKQRLPKEVVARPVLLNTQEKKKNGPVSWSPITRLYILIEKRYWKFLAAKR
jgi:hypothetical protein